MKRSQLQYLVLLLMLIFVGYSCDNNSGPDGGENGNPAVVEGRVDNLSSGTAPGDTTTAKFKQVEGAVVQAMRVNAEGNLEPVSEDSAETDADGEFTLEIGGQAVENIGDQIVITAEQAGDTAKSFITSQVEQGGTARVKPLSFESTSETTVYQQLRAQGNTDQVSNADIEVVVTESVARDIEADSSIAGEVVSALVAKEEAKVEFYNAQGVDVPQSQRDDIHELEQEAQRELENRLSTSSEAGVQDAYDAFLESYANVDIEAGVNPTAAAKSSEVSSRVVVNQLPALSDTAQVDVRVEMAHSKTFSLTAGVQEQFEGLGVSQGNIDNIEQAGVSAREDIRSLEGEVTEEEVREIFAEFRDQVVDAIDEESGLGGGLFTAANASINNPGGAKENLESALEGNADVLSVMDAYNRFYTDIEATVDDTFDDAVEAGVAAYYTQLLIMINAPA